MSGVSYEVVSLAVRLACLLLLETMGVDVEHGSHHTCFFGLQLCGENIRGLKGKYIGYPKLLCRPWM